MTVKFLQSDRLVEAAAVNVHGSSITLELKKQNKTFFLLIPLGIYVTANTDREDFFPDALRQWSEKVCGQ